MTILGLTGGLDVAHSDAHRLPYDFIHDATAVLIRDGRVLAAIEEERLNRIKHTNKRPHRSLRFCLESAGIGPEALDAVVFYATEPYVKRVLETLHLSDFTQKELMTPRGMVQRLFRDELGYELEAAKIHFVDHHTAHAISAFAMAGFPDALVVTLDGQGEGISGVVYDGRGRTLKPLRTFTEQHSLGYLYRDVIRFLGYEMFDEYKVMGMAPYGDPAKYRALFQTFYELLPGGDYRLHLERVRSLFHVTKPRRKGDVFNETHQHLAAALQDAVETIGLHVLTHFQKETGHKNLCLAGGVAHNCSLNGRVLYDGGFEKLFVQPAAHDAGCALGAAIAVQLALAPQSTVEPLTHVLWGTDIGGDAQIEPVLRAWSGLVSIERCPDIVNRTADLLAAGKAIGWVQGRSEFGPRALGNRSILADPRPAENKDIINRMVKKREAYRPFAPSVLEEKVDDYFITTATQKTFPTMSVILDVRPEMRTLLGAITHVDGTARVQTVSRAANARYWELIKAFGDRTGVPMLLNTSFNNHAEPIVDSVYDGVVCFLTTDLHALVAGDWLVTKKPDLETNPAPWLALKVGLPVTITLAAERRWVSATEQAWVHELRFTYHHGKTAKVSPALHALLAKADGRTSFSELGRAAGLSAAETTALLPELRDHWTNRMVVLTP
ncbi:carbamoyltransferase [Opitutaceae bacterium]